MDSNKLCTRGITTRAAGILLPIFSLPSRYGIGTIGEEAFRFIDFLKRTGQTYWQILPIGPTSYGDSPYQSFSAFAANPYFIDPDVLKKKGLLTDSEAGDDFSGKDSSVVDYGELYRTRLQILEKATERFDPAGIEFCRFQEQNADWLDDYALFMSLKEEHGMISFSRWEEPLRLREPAALRSAAVRLEKRILFWKIIQYLFFEQWGNLKKYAHENGIKIIGDIPIYVSGDSSDLWTHKELFLVDERLEPISVSGCPPDAFAPAGQLWGNPLYDWDYHRKTDFHWWIRRLRYAESVYDIVRIDHFRGFSSYYAIPAENKTAQGGRWIKSPGREFIAAVKAHVSEKSIIAEDLGYLTEDVRNLLDESGFPGMKVLQFAFDSREKGDYLPHNYCRNCVVYTGTHDNTTTRDWQFSAPPADVMFAKEYLNIGSSTNFTDAFVRAALASVAATAIIPMQDYLAYGAESRTNTPGTIGKNWQWRVKKGVFTDNFAAYIGNLVSLYGR